jgi:hypothetical protein
LEGLSFAKEARHLAAGPPQGQPHR